MNPEQLYHVIWEMDIYAETPREAAEKAWGFMRHEDSTANYFTVFDVTGRREAVDLATSTEDEE